MTAMPIISIAAEVVGKEGDPFFSVPGAQPDLLAFPGGVSQARREDMQLWDFLTKISEWGGVHPLSVEVVPAGEDPPDRVLRSANHKWATELTELTIGDVRSGLAKLRSFGRQLEARLRDAPEKFAHLRGREVTLEHNPRVEIKLDRQGGSLADLLETELTVDKGSTEKLVRHAVGTDEGSSKPAGPCGDYGQIGPFYVQVQERPEDPDLIVVTAGIQADIFASEITDALNKRIAAKDHPPNEVLVIGCALPDPAGYICPLDYTLFHEARKLGERGVLPLSNPKHLKGVALHCLRQQDFGQLYRAEGAILPWTL